MKTFWLFLCLLFLAALDQPQGLDRKISGTVFSLQTGNPLEAVLIGVEGTKDQVRSDRTGGFEIMVPGNSAILIFSLPGFETYRMEVGHRNQMNVGLSPVNELIEVEEEISDLRFSPGTKSEKRSAGNGAPAMEMSVAADAFDYYSVYHNTEEYDHISENIFHSARGEPLSTFSIDVDAASYSNVRRMLNIGQLPPKDAVRIEEMVNYFNYDYPQPAGDDPFSITTEYSSTPWNPIHKLLHIGLQGRKLDYESLKPSNLVFLIDVSGSMSAPNKLPLLKSSLNLLIKELGSRDRVAIVAYAGAAGLVLPSCGANSKTQIMTALENLEAGGSTAGGAGIELAYRVAIENLIEGGNNRVILATDGDFNVGVSSTSEMVRLIEEKRKKGVYLTITGFGMGNYKDGRMEQISNAGNGNYFYIDNIQEARKVFVKEMRANLFTIAKDVKIQIEFNPEVVQGYRLIGYENRILNHEDFNDDRKDAGELGAGHTVTALYEIIPVGVSTDRLGTVDALKYQQEPSNSGGTNRELTTIKFRYKNPNRDRSRLVQRVVPNVVTAWGQTSEDFRFSAAVASFGMLLRDSDHKGDATFQDVISWSWQARGNDTNGYRMEFINLVKSSRALARR